VLETRKGNPLSLSIIYSVVAQNLSLPVYGVNLPNHFILAFMDKHKINSVNGNENPYGVLFYLNPFSKGAILREADIEHFLSDLKITPQRHHFEPCSNSQILQRMLTNLISSFQQVGNAQKVEELIQLRNLFES
jgi:regulator of sirC expression with transglutaminase-like and TPR domain